jgi:hypothetical protein
MFPMDGLLDGLICSNCEQCKPNMVKRELGGVMCEECHQIYEQLPKACPHWPRCGCGTQSGPHTCEWRA